MQGFGNVGSIAVSLFQQAGAHIVAVQDHSTTLWNNDGIDIAALQTWQQRYGAIAGFPGASVISNNDFWLKDFDILLPAALEGQINASRANELSCKLILEGANGPTLPDADNILHQRGVTISATLVA